MISGIEMSVRHNLRILEFTAGGRDAMVGNLGIHGRDRHLDASGGGVENGDGRNAA